jgi:hypothetical protein
VPSTKRIGIPWYRRDQWHLLRAVAPDSEQLEPSYPAWEKNASEQIWDLERRGFVVYRVDVDLGELLRWCEIKGLTPDASTRTRFAQEKTSG